jgi:hypothetical protein
MPKETKLNPWELRPGERLEDLDVRISITWMGCERALFGNEDFRLLMTVGCKDGTGWAEGIAPKGAV